MTEQNSTPQETAPRAKTGTPRWVIVLGIITIIVLTVFVVLQILGVQHGPDLHNPSGFAGWLAL
jgi:hypothetical protein